MEKKKTHWKALTNPDYIGAYSLMESGKPQDLVVKISEVKREGVTQVGGKTEECTVAHLEGQKPFVINSTNAKTIEKIYGTPFIDDWAGKYITLFCDKTKYKGDLVDCLRIRPVEPQVKLPKLTKDHPKWTAIIDKVRAGEKVTYFKQWFEIDTYTSSLIKKIAKT